MYNQMRRVLNLNSDRATRWLSCTCM